MKIQLGNVQDWVSLARQANWSAIKLAELCKVSMSTLERHFRKHMGMTPKAWVSQQRQHEAKRAIQSGLTVKEASIQLGYQHPTQFSREFKKFWGYCPTSPIPVHTYFGGRMTGIFLIGNMFRLRQK